MEMILTSSLHLMYDNKRDCSLYKHLLCDDNCELDGTEHWHLHVITSVIWMAGMKSTLGEGEPKSKIIGYVMD